MIRLFACVLKLSLVYCCYRTTTKCRGSTTVTMQAQKVRGRCLIWQCISQHNRIALPPSTRCALPYTPRFDFS